MAKKVIISDLVVKVGADTKLFDRKIKSIEKDVIKASKSLVATDKQQIDANRKLESQARLRLRADRNYRELRNRSLKDARVYEKAYIKLSLKGDKARMAALKSIMSEKVRFFKKQEALQEKLQRQEMRATKQQERADKNLHKLKLLQLAEEEAIAKRHYRNSIERSKKLVKGTAKIAKGALSATATAASLAVAAVGATIGVAMMPEESLKNMRSAQSNLKMGLSTHGEESQYSQWNKRIVNEAVQAGLNPNKVMSNLAQAFIAEPDTSTKQIYKAQMGIAMQAKAQGLSDDRASDAQTAMREIQAGDFSNKHIKVIKNSMGSVFNELAKALKISNEELTTLASSGKLGKYIRQDPRRLYAVQHTWSDLVYQGGRQQVAARQGTMPIVSGKLKSAWQIAMQDFGTGEEKGLITFLQSLTKILTDNQQLFSNMGKTLGAVLMGIANSLTAWVASGGLKDIQEFFNGLKNADIKEFTQQLIQLGSIIGGLVSMITKVIGFLLKNLPLKQMGFILNKVEHPVDTFNEYAPKSVKKIVGDSVDAVSSAYKSFVGMATDKGQPQTEGQKTMMNSFPNSTVPSMLLNRAANSTVNNSTVGASSSYNNQETYIFTTKEDSISKAKNLGINQKGINYLQSRPSVN